MVLNALTADVRSFAARQSALVTSEQALGGAALALTRSMQMKGVVRRVLVRNGFVLATTHYVESSSMQVLNKDSLVLNTS